MKKLQMFCSAFLLMTLLVSCGKKDTLSPLEVSDEMILDELLAPNVVANNGNLKDNTLYIDLDLNDLNSPIAKALQLNAEKIEMSEDIYLTRSAIESILGNASDDPIFGNGIQVPKGDFMKMPSTEDQANSRGICLHYCRCWEVGTSGLICIEISICY